MEGEVQAGTKPEWAIRPWHSEKDSLIPEKILSFQPAKALHDANVQALTSGGEIPHLSHDMKAIQARSVCLRLLDGALLVIDQNFLEKVETLEGGSERSSTDGF
ncbi:hypothetical protein HPP92_005338 [Vanilla planifolia]|uniref:Uncharacterized protein n=1 Tax=Vanilla planifolia TaxID=51239 RepID=A0A835RMI3_VANPL|nr:hypothetical protein HPP92_005338 [Vanilla planifolia]